VPTKVIAVANQKGGVGKTTTSVNVAACLAANGQRVLLLDLDPQANATSGLGLEKREGGSAYAALLGEAALAEKFSRLPTNAYRSSRAKSICAVLKSNFRASRTTCFRLKNALQPLLNSGQFDLVMIDCPPALGILTLNVFTAADWLLIPLQCEYYALEGISMINRVISQLRDSGVNPNLEILGVVMTMFDGRTRLAPQVVHEVRQHFGDLVCDTLIPRTTRLAEAPSFGKPIIYYDKYSAGASAYEVLTEELSKRIRQKTDAAAAA
jgi:chromosome partitioning protein